MTDVVAFNSAVASVLGVAGDAFRAVCKGPYETNAAGVTVKFYADRKGLISVVVSRTKDGKQDEFIFSHPTPMTADQGTGMYFFWQDPQHAGKQIRIGVGVPNVDSNSVSCIGRRNAEDFAFDGMWVADTDWMFVAKIK
jgi:hypothetical protein